MDRGKWFVRVGMLILVLGFFMPTMLVSCSGMAGFQQSFSLSDLASTANQPILYFFLLGALVTGVVSFLPQSKADQARTFLLIQGGAMLAGLLGLAVSLLSLTSQIQSGTYGMFQVKPAFGAIFLAGGLILFLVGWIEQWNWLGQPAVGYPPGRGVEEEPLIPRRTAPVPPPRFEPRLEEETREPRILTASLEPVQGDLQRQTIQVNHDNFTIGRVADNSLVLRDTAVSRHHARLRYAQGAWFIQDTESTAGVIVNGQRVPATRLESGDEIEIAGNTFIFHC